MPQNVILWNLETVPDLPRLAIADALVGKPEEEVREALDNKFHKQFYHSIVCIGVFIGHRW